MVLEKAQRPSFGDGLKTELDPDKLALIRSLDAHIRYVQELRERLIRNNNQPLDAAAISRGIGDSAFGVQVVLNSRAAYRRSQEPREDP